MQGFVLDFAAPNGGLLLSVKKTLSKKSSDRKEKPAVNYGIISHVRMSLPLLCLCYNSYFCVAREDGERPQADESLARALFSWGEGCQSRMRLYCMYTATMHYV